VDNKVDNVTEIKLPTLTCKRCGHDWHPKKQSMPTVCPGCNSPYWNKERLFKSKGAEND